MILTRDNPSFGADDYVFDPIPTGTLLASVDRQMSAEIALQDESGPIPGHAVLTVRNSVLREDSGTLTFVYKPVTLTAEGRGNMLGAGFDLFRTELTGFGGQQIDYIVYAADPPYSVGWRDDTISMRAGMYEEFPVQYIRTNATSYDESGTISVHGNIISSYSGTTDWSGEAFAPVESVAAVPLPPAFIAGLLTMAGTVGVLGLKRNRRLGANT
jgi:hypothetical protein